VRYADSVQLTIIPTPPNEVVMPTDFAHADQLINAGLRSGRSMLARTTQFPPLRRAA
jgi:hypothetical protein